MLNFPKKFIHTFDFYHYITFLCQSTRRLVGLPQLPLFVEKLSIRLLF